MNERSLSIKETILGVICAILSLLGAQVGASLGASVFIVLKLPEWIGYMVYGILYITFAYCLLGVVCKNVLHTTKEDCYIRKVKIHSVWIVGAVVLPLAVSSILVCVPGELMHNKMNAEALLRVIFIALFYSGAAGIVEEMVFRGIIMKVMEKRFGKLVAILVPSMIFGLLHATGGMSIVDILILFIAGTSVGVMFSLITYENGSIWASVIVHVLWNIIIVGDIFRIGVGDSSEAIYFYKLQQSSSFLTGGTFGIEASFISVIGYILVSLLAVVLIRKKQLSNQ